MLRTDGFHTLLSRPMRWWSQLNPLLRFGLKFCLLFGLCDALSITSWSDKPLSVFLSAYAHVSNWVLVAFGQSSHVTGSTIEGRSVTLTIMRGCDALDPILVLGSADTSYSAATDTIVVLVNFDVVDKSKSGGTKIGLESKNYFWLPFAFYLALAGATPMPWRRRAWALFWGFLTANVLMALTLAVYIANHASDISMIVLSPFWMWAARGLLELLLVVSGPSILVYLFIWPFACFRREDLARLIPGWGGLIPKPSVAAVPNRRTQLKASRSRERRCSPAGVCSPVPAHPSPNSTPWSNTPLFVDPPLVEGVRVQGGALVATSPAPKKSNRHICSNPFNTAA